MPGLTTDGCTQKMTIDFPTDAIFHRRGTRQIVLPEGVERKHLFDEATCEAHRHKWIESEKAGHDLGDAAIRDWHKLHWRKFTRERWMEHLNGQTFWDELDNNDFGLLARNFADHSPLVGQIVEQLNQGAENLGVIQWAEDNGRPMSTVLGILGLLDINSRRLAHELDIDEDGFIQTMHIRHKPSALVIDGDEGVIASVGDALKGEGMDVTGAPSCDAAMDRVERHHFDLFVIDMLTPGRHGAEVAWYLRRHGVMAPVLAISPAAERWCEDDLIDCGFTRLLTKPLDMQGLRHIAREVVSEVGAKHPRA